MTAEEAVPEVLQATLTALPIQASHTKEKQHQLKKHWKSYSKCPIEIILSGSTITRTQSCQKVRAESDMTGIWNKA